MARADQGSSTIYQVAHEAGLSIATVSRVLNGKKNVSETARQKVLTACKKLHYRPSINARQLHGESLFDIGVILGTDSETYTPFAMKVYEALKFALHNQGYRAKRITIASEKSQLPPCKGYIAVGLQKSDNRIKRLESNNLPLVTIGDPRNNGFWVASNDHQGGYRAAEYLIQQGCKHIHYVCQHLDHDLSRLRLNGMQYAIATRGLPAPGIHALDNKTGIPVLDAYRLGLRLFDGTMAIDGIVSFSDEVATGLHCAATDLSINVPGQLKITGYDGVVERQHLALTTIAQNLPQLADKAASLIIKAINKEAVTGQLVDISLRKGQTA
ncbi:LacI family transcriptional regulator [Endozoicomonas sp. Mp262]|uniref:LacI family DNA-binding transcriptional regulator n=1 Tax=Endozoicomonas sp. Mp262 TaxID=2919499 RepID=UPI0021D87B3B